MEPQSVSEQNTLEIMITNLHTTNRSKSYKDLCEEYQKNSKTTFFGYIDMLLLKIVTIIRIIWSCIPIWIRGPSNNSQLFLNFVDNLNINIQNKLTFSNTNFETTLKENKSALLLAYVCNDNIKRDIKKLLKNQTLNELSILYPLCPLSNLTDYFHQHIINHLPKSYSVYLLLFGTNLLEQVFLLDIFKPIDEQIQRKIKQALEKFNHNQKELLQGSREQLNSIKIINDGQQHFKIPKILQLGDLSFPNSSESKTEEFQ